MRPNPGAIPSQRLPTDKTPFVSVSAGESTSLKNSSGTGSLPATPFESMLEKARAVDSDADNDSPVDRKGEEFPGAKSRVAHSRKRTASCCDRTGEPQSRPDEAALLLGFHEFQPAELPAAVRVSLDGGDASPGSEEQSRSSETQSTTAVEIPSGSAATDSIGADLSNAREPTEDSGGGVDAMLQWLEPVSEGETAGWMEGVDPPLNEGVRTPGDGQLNRDGDGGSATKAGIAGWTPNGAANLTASGVTPIAGATATGASLDGTWSAQQETNVGKNPTDTTSTGSRKIDGTSRAYRDSIAQGSPDPTPILGADFAPGNLVEMRSSELTGTLPVRELREGLLEGMLEHSANVRASSAESLDISIRAGGGTEIAVQFSYVDGVVHAHAQCERGDYQLLSTLWHDLQLNLSKHGISLSTLVPPSSESNLGTGSMNGGFGSQRENGASWGRDSRPSREELLMEASSPANAAGTVGGWLKLQSRRLFETWA